MKKKLIFSILIVFIFLFLFGFLVFVKEREKKMPPQVPVSPTKEETKEETIILPFTSKETRPEAISKVEKILQEKKVYPVEVCDSKKFPPLSGRIFLSLRPVDKEKMGIFNFDLGKKEIEEFLMEDSNNWAVTFSKDRKKITFISDRTGTFQVFVGDSNKKEIRQVTMSRDEENERKTKPVFSPDGKKIAFTKMKLTGFSFADNWQTFLTDLQGKEEFLAEGVSPVFSPDGNYLLLLKNAGVYLYNFKNKEWERVIELRDEENKLIWGTVNMRLSLSPDGKKLAILDFPEEIVYLFQINSWSPFNYKLKGIIRTAGFWGAFSPDGNYLAFWEADLKKEEKEGGILITPENSRLVVYETCNLEKVFSFNLKGFDPEDGFLTDWIE